MRLLFLCFAMVFSATAAESTAKVDINNAPKTVIETLPGVGPKLADEIIKGRPFKAVEDLDKVKGIGPKKLEQIRPRVVIMPMRTALPNPRVELPSVRVNINTATQTDLEKLPGIGPKKAEAIIAKRPFRRIDELMNVPGIKKSEYEKIKDQIRVQ